MFAWSATHPDVEVRELDRLAHYLRTIRGGGRESLETCRYDPLPTVAVNGDVVLLSPELAGIRDENYGDFLAGNVLTESLTEILAVAWRLPYVSEFLDGLAACRETCGFFDFCRGAQAGNRYFENGRFDFHRDQLLPGIQTGTGAGSGRDRPDDRCLKWHSIDGG